jgi:hypothetical protein
VRVKTGCNSPVYFVNKSFYNMNRLQQAFNNAAVNDLIKKPDAVKLARQFDEQEEASVNLLKECLPWVGMDLGSRISEHLASIQGKRFNTTEYFYEKPVGEQ